MNAIFGVIILTNTFANLEMIEKSKIEVARQRELAEVHARKAQELGGMLINI